MENQQEVAQSQEGSSNRTFVMLVAVLGGLLVLGIGAFVAWAFVVAPRMRADIEARDESVFATNTAVALAAVATETHPATATATDTPVPTSTLAPPATPSSPPQPPHRNRRQHLALRHPQRTAQRNRRRSPRQALESWAAPCWREV